jgi:hypothetical protein
MPTGSLACGEISGGHSCRMKPTHEPASAADQVLYSSFKDGSLTDIHKPTSSFSSALPQPCTKRTSAQALCASRTDSHRFPQTHASTRAPAAQLQAHTAGSTAPGRLLRLLGEARVRLQCALSHSLVLHE